MGQQLAAWVKEEFASAKLGDSRWRHRLMKMASRAAHRPSGRITEVFKDAAERQGAYGLLECSSVRSESIGAAVFAATATRSVGLEFVFVPVDGSSLSLTDLAEVKFGTVGTPMFGGRGLKVISALAVSPEGVTLGLLSQIWWTRTHSHKDTINCSDRPTGAKETRHWLAAIEQSRQQLKEARVKTRCWFQIDREADAWPILTAADADEHWFTIRSHYNRRVRLAGGSMSYLQPCLAARPVTCFYKLPVNAGPGRAARIAKMEVRAATVTLDLKNILTGSHFPKTLNAIIARELTPPEGEKRIEWTLLTNRPVETTEDIAQVIYGYSQRWRIEDFHRAWKKGACNAERMQLRSVPAVIKWATLLASVATRIERLKHLSRTQPEQPAASEFTKVELKALALLRFGKKPPPNYAEVNIHLATQWLAELGGYTGATSSGGPPGATTLARGFARLETAVETLEALKM